MKNVQVIDGAQNCTFSIFQATDEEFSLVFPEPGQDIEYAEDLETRRNSEYPEKREDAITPSAINAAQRKLFGSKAM